MTRATSLRPRPNGVYIARAGAVEKRPQLHGNAIMDFPHPMAEFLRRKDVPSRAGAPSLTLPVNQEGWVGWAPGRKNGQCPSLPFGFLSSGSSTHLSTTFTSTPHKTQ